MLYEINMKEIKNNYTGTIYTNKVSFKNFILGQVTDDSELLLALTHSIL